MLTVALNVWFVYFETTLMLVATDKDWYLGNHVHTASSAFERPNSFHRTAANCNVSLH